MRITERMRSKMTVENSMKKFTVVSLGFQTVVLFGLAVLAWRSSLTVTWDFARGIALMATGYYAVLFVVSFWLTGEHYSKAVRKRNLQLWAVICIFLFLTPLFASLDGIIRYHSTQSLTNLVIVVLFLIPTILVLIFSSRDNEGQRL